MQTSTQVVRAPRRAQRFFGLGLLAALPALLAVLPTLLGPTSAQAQTIVPVNGANTWPSTQRTLSYINGLSRRSASAGKRVLSGQNFAEGDDWTSPYSDVIEGLAKDTGKYVALAGAEMGGHTFDGNSGRNLQNCQRLAAFYNAGRGGLVTVNWNFDNPFVASGDIRDRTDGDLRKLLPGGELRARWTAQLDEIVALVKFFKVRSVVIVWRPFQEMNGNWFWWGHRDPQAFRALWKDMFDYLHARDAWQNVLWCYSPNNADGKWPGIATYATYFPGSDLCDIVGITNYRDDQAIPDYPWLVAQHKPIWITEGLRDIAGAKSSRADNMVVINSLRKSYPQVSAFVSWHSWRDGDAFNHIALRHNNNAKELLSDPWVITRDEVPAR